MRILPVIDLLGGQVVRGLGGQRELYRPIQSTIAADAQPASIARAFVEHFGLKTAYVADLDAIMSPAGHQPLNTEAYQQIAAAGLSFWLDAGIGTPEGARQVRDELAPRNISIDYVIGLETLAAERDLAGIAAELGRERMIFSLDMKQGALLTHVPRWADADPASVVMNVLAAGISRIIVLDLADVGMQAGTNTLDLCRRLRREFGGAIQLVAGGGVRGRDDLAHLADAGCDSALVASALHDRRLTASDIDWISQYRAKPHQD